MRLSPAVQARFREAEMSSERDWIEVAVDVQREVLARFGLPPTEVNLEMLRRQATSETSLYVKYNRAARGHLRVGDLAPDVRVGTLAGTGSSRSLLSHERPGRPLVILAGSYS